MRKYRAIASLKIGIVFLKRPCLSGDSVKQSGFGVTRSKRPSPFGSECEPEDLTQNLEDVLIDPGDSLSVEYDVGSDPKG